VPPAVSEATNTATDVTALLAMTASLQTEITGLRAQVGTLNSEISLLRNQAGRDVNSTTAMIVAIVLPPLLLFLYMLSDRIAPLLDLKNLLKGRTKDLAPPSPPAASASVSLSLKQRRKRLV